VDLDNVDFDNTVLRQWRHDSGMRPEEVAYRAGISVTYLFGLENGLKRNPSARVLAGLAHVYRRDLTELYPVGAR
jgi:transcriptional regulator with XRE-family HTH domain